MSLVQKLFRTGLFCPAAKDFPSCRVDIVPLVRTPNEAKSYPLNRGIKYGDISRITETGLRNFRHELVT